MSLHLHRGTDTTVLADGLAELLADPPDDPFAEELVVVPAKGVERWLTQRLSHRLGSSRGDDGVCAGVRFLNPRSLVALLTGTERDDPWDPDRFVWPLLDIVDASLHEAWCATLARHLGHGDDSDQGVLRRDRRYSVARRLAGLFASYAVQRPSVLTDWQAGRDTDGAGSDLPDDLTWQAELWRRLVAAVDVPPPDERHRRVVGEIRAGADLALPDRLSMFGHTRMPVTEIELLRAVGEVREVHLWLPQASPAAWDRIAHEVAVGPVRRADDTSGRRVQHRLVSTLGRDSRELQRSLTLLGDVADRAAVVASVVDPAVAPAETPSLLQLLQADVRADGDTGRAQRDRRVDPADRSVSVHACHGPARQVEVLREVLVGLLQDDPTLEPRDILVMCPDVEAYAPLFAATFGLADAALELRHPGHSLRVRVADRGAASTNPLLAIALDLVRIAGGRATATEVLDLAASGPARRRFRLSETDLATLTAWTESAGIRWGLTAGLRSTYAMQAFPENTWRSGLDRILLGVAMAETGELVDRTLPLDEIGSSDISLVGRLAELVDRLERVVTALRAATEVDDWLRILGEGVLALGDVGPSEAWQRTQFDRELDQVREAAQVRGGTTPLGLNDVRALLERRLEPRPTRANFRTGHLTVCTMVPMRSVPHRVVCLVGVDDGVFPRSTVADGDDVLARDPMTGERDPRGEDRQLLLDAVMAAGDRLVVTYTGADLRSNERRPPAVPVGELLDALESTSAGAKEQVVVRERLQPFDPSYFSDHDPRSFDRASLAGARAVVGERRPRQAFVTHPLGAPAPAGDEVTLEAVQRFFVSPVKGFLRQGLGVALPLDHEELPDAVPVSLQGLEEWQVGDRILRRVVDGALDQQVVDSELARGALPPGALGQGAMRLVCTRVQAVYDGAAADLREPPEDHEVDVPLALGRLTGVVAGVRGSHVVRLHYSSLKPKHRWAAWLDLLALSAARPEVAWTAHVHGRGSGKDKDRALCARYGPVADAMSLLDQVVDVYRRGLREPLPVPMATAFAYATAVAKGRDETWPTRTAWTSEYGGEQHEPEHVRVFGRAAPLDVLLTPPRDDEDWGGAPHRLGRYAMRLWDPVLAHTMPGSA